MEFQEVADRLQVNKELPNILELQDGSYKKYDLSEVEQGKLETTLNTCEAFILVGQANDLPESRDRVALMHFGQMVPQNYLGYNEEGKLEIKEVNPEQSFRVANATFDLDQSRPGNQFVYEFPLAVAGNLEANEKVFLQESTRSIDDSSKILGVSGGAKIRLSESKNWHLKEKPVVHDFSSDFKLSALYVKE